jgi:hypothetical protein
MAVEEPTYKTVLRDGAFEVRDYPSLVVAEVTVTGDQREAAGKGFRLLAGYIFGGNRRRQGIPMTAPVTMARAGEKIPMTAPVAQTPTTGGWIVRFIMPSGYSLQTLPEPADPRVRLAQSPARRVAVLRFSGVASPQAVEAKTAELLDMARARRLSVDGPVTLAQYDPPWTLWFLRRNEVMATIRPA